MTTVKTILVVDDEPRTRQGLQRMLETHGAGAFDVRAADNGREALELLKQTPVHLLITDIRMPEITGLNLVDSIETAGLPSIPSVILISGYAEFDYAQQAIRLGVSDYLLKPVRKDKLIASVERALQHWEERNRTAQLQRIADPKLLSGNEGTPMSEPVQAAVRYVEEHLGESFGLREVAQAVHLNPSYFSVLFKDQLQMTFSEYVARKRLQKAKQLLLQTKLPIAEIAERVGYQTAKYFSKIFKEYEGHNPGYYRNGPGADGEDEI